MDRSRLQSVLRVKFGRCGLFIRVVVVVVGAPSSSGSDRIGRREGRRTMMMMMMRWEEQGEGGNVECGEAGWENFRKFVENECANPDCLTGGTAID